MKLSVVGLFVLGAVAAVAAAVLVASLQAPAGPKTEVVRTDEPAPTVSVLVAATELPAMTVLGAEAIATREVDEAVAPEGAFADPVQIIGKVLKVPLTAEQAITAEHFASDGSSLHLMSALERGKRAVNVLLSDPMGMEELLYPGCRVDVLASLKVRDSDDMTEDPLSVTMLQGVTVLAVGTRTLVAPGGEQEDGDFVIAQRRRPSVTLLVDPEEAELLKLAMHNGSISLTMRNPMDDTLTEQDGTRLVDLSPILEAREMEAKNRELQAALAMAKEQARQAKLEGFEMESAEFDSERARKQMEIDREKLDHEMWEVSQERLKETANTWETVVLRGGTAETITFESPTSSSDQ